MVSIVPMPAEAAAAGSAVAFTDAWSRGDILHALDGREHVVSAGFAKAILKSNQVVVTSKPTKLDVRPGGPLVLSSWTLPVPAGAGVYRAEVLVDGVPFWRGFVRVTN